MRRVMLIMLENEDTRYEFYMRGIKESNVSDKIVRWELRYNLIHNMVLGGTMSFDNKVIGQTFEGLVSKLLLKGFEVVTFETKNFA